MFGGEHPMVEQTPRDGVTTVGCARMIARLHRYDGYGNLRWVSRPRLGGFGLCGRCARHAQAGCTREDGIRDLLSKAGLLAFLALATLLIAGCGGGDDTASSPPASATATSTAAPVSSASSSASLGAGQAESIQDAPFALNMTQPVPPDFRAAYQRRALIAVQFYKEGQDPFYPQGLQPDVKVQRSMESLSRQYPTIEFFNYEITNPGFAETSEGLEQGEFGTLAVQLGVGITPYVVTLAPDGDQYVIDNLFQGYTPRAVLSQALYDLSATEVESNTSDIDVVIDQLQLTDSGGGLEYITISNQSPREVNLQGFSLRLLDPQTGEVNPDSVGVQINDEVIIQPGESASIGRLPSVVDAEGDRVEGVFEGGDALQLAPGDQLALIDSGGAVANTYTV